TRGVTNFLFGLRMDEAGEYGGISPFIARLKRLPKRIFHQVNTISTAPNYNGVGLSGHKEVANMVAYTLRARLVLTHKNMFQLVLIFYNPQISIIIIKVITVGVRIINHFL